MSVYFIILLFSRQVYKRTQIISKMQKEKKKDKIQNPFLIKTQ